MHLPFVDAAVSQRMQHGDDGADDARRCVEFAALLPFLFGKFRDAVLIGAPEKILVLGQILGMDFIGEEVDYITQLVLIQIR